MCVSDTHNTQPTIPPGDLLLHAGDLSNWGTFSEIQAQLTWLSQQDHKYKVVVAGNHDLLLDAQFREQHPHKWIQALAAGCGTEIDKLKTVDDLDWGDILYLQNSSATLEFPGNRKITIYGSPFTPKHGLSAFQHLPSEDVWFQKLPRGIDIVLTHGPPRGHLDGVKKSGCVFLAQEVARARPRLVVYGHIHVGHKMEREVYDGVGRAHEAILGQWGGWGTLFGMALSVLCGWSVPNFMRGAERRTTFVNAAVVEGWEAHVVKHEATVVQI